MEGSKSSLTEIQKCSRKGLFFSFREKDRCIYPPNEKYLYPFSVFLNPGISLETEIKFPLFHTCVTYYILFQKINLFRGIWFKSPPYANILLLTNGGGLRRGGI